MSLRLAVALLCALPWLRSARLLPSNARELIDHVFAPLCHHLPGRVLILGGEPMCVCSRCAGLYAGLALGFLLGRPRLEVQTFRAMFSVALAATVLDVVTQDVGLHPPLAATRLASGLMLGWVAAAWMVRSLESSTNASLPQSLATRGTS